MSATNKVINASGTRVDLLGSQAAQFVILCGIAGGRLTPLEVSPEGWLLTSGTDLDL